MTFKLRTLVRGLPALQEKAKNTIITKRSQVFLACLLELLAGWPRFCFGCPVTVLAVSLMDGLAIGGAVSIASKVAGGLSG